MFSTVAMLKFCRDQHDIHVTVEITLSLYIIIIIIIIITILKAPLDSDGNGVIYQVYIINHGKARVKFVRRDIKEIDCSPLACWYIGG